MTRFIVLTLFKEMFDGFLKKKKKKRAIDEEKVSIDIIDIRDFSENKHKKVDFPPYGGGSGMVMSAVPLGNAIDHAIKMLDSSSYKIIYLSPRGKVLNYNVSKSLADSNTNYILVCGHYEGIDERVIEEYNIEEISIGDYVLTGGELASEVLMDSVIRLIPGVISTDSLLEESHTDGLLEYPQYTKPDMYKGREVPEILKSGNHKKIAEYRKKEAMRITQKYRPDLLKKYNDIIINNIDKKEGK